MNLLKLTIIRHRGKGLGRNEDGRTECVQLKRRTENIGVGFEEMTPTEGPKWGNAFWESVYNDAAKNLSVIVNTDVAAEDRTESSVEEESQTKKQPKQVPIKKAIKKVSKKADE